MRPRLPVRAAILKRKTYEAPAEGRAGKIRLDFNENTAGCGPAARGDGAAGAACLPDLKLNLWPRGW